MGVYKCDSSKQFDHYFTAPHSENPYKRLKKALYILFNHTSINPIANAFNNWIGEKVVTVDYHRIAETVKEKMNGILTDNEINHCIDSAITIDASNNVKSKNENCGVYLGEVNDNWNQLQLSRMLFKINKKDEAKKILLSLYADKNKISEVIIDTISLLFREGEIKKALTILMETLTDHIFSATSYFNFSEFVIKHDYYHEAQALLETACKNYPKTAGLFALLSSVYKTLNNNQENKRVHQHLLDIYFEQLKKNPDRNDIRLSISDVLRYEERYNDAFSILDEIEKN